MDQEILSLIDTVKQQRGIGHANLLIAFFQDLEPCTVNSYTLAKIEFMVLDHYLCLKDEKSRLDALTLLLKDFCQFIKNVTTMGWQKILEREYSLNFAISSLHIQFNKIYDFYQKYGPEFNIVNCKILFSNPANVQSRMNKMENLIPLLECHPDINQACVIRFIEYIASLPLIQDTSVDRRDRACFMLETMANLLVTKRIVFVDPDTVDLPALYSELSRRIEAYYSAHKCPAHDFPVLEMPTLKVAEPAITADDATTTAFIVIPDPSSVPPPAEFVSAVTTMVNTLILRAAPVADPSVESVEPPKSRGWFSWGR